MATVSNGASAAGPDSLSSFQLAIPAPVQPSVGATSTYVSTSTQMVACGLVIFFFISALVVYWWNFRAFRRKYAEISERIDGHINSRVDPGPSPGHAYSLASRGPKHARDAEIQSAESRWRHLSIAFPHLDLRGEHMRSVILVSRDYTNVQAVKDTQNWMEGRIRSHIARNGRKVIAPEWIKDLGDDFDALRHPQLAIANPAIYTFPFFLTWQRRHQWGVLPYGVHNRLGVVCSAKHPDLKMLEQIAKDYNNAIVQAKADNAAFWVNDPKHAQWLPLLLKRINHGPMNGSDTLAPDQNSRIFSVGAYLHKELVPLICAILPDSEASSTYARLAQEIEVTQLPTLLSNGSQIWPEASAVIVDLAVLPSGLEEVGWKVIRVAHCVYVPIGIGYSVASVPLLFDGTNWSNDLLRDVGDSLASSAESLAAIGIELDERLWTAR